MDAVKSWMSSPAIVARDTESLPRARSMLVAEGIRRLPVVNAAGDLVGIVTEGDINRISDSPDRDVHAYNLYYRVYDLPLREIMRRPVITVSDLLRRLIATETATECGSLSEQSTGSA